MSGIVALITPMKRGLKESLQEYFRVYLEVALITPMKRGLKESGCGSRENRPQFVALITPMKRGLKDLPLTCTGLKV